ncbi:GFA family protein [Methylovirgula sp. 4M-Z18]|uniref:GFA family protein n=1 Tax=Methylovirgula sp. 4M-Z18 TaxID=2293567 RepID=UPI000E2F51BF|nr:GFA family protein [Methylovirgula sp. 4M-Z18]RFB78607.1 GFA family protein [Methylovirgula sp. 4M-Z18]
MSRRTLAGRCYCGAVHYVVADDFAYALNCHCSDCRRTTGSAFKSFAGIARERLTITKGAEDLLIFGEENANNTHCRHCGSLLFSVVREGAYVHVAMGTLIDDPGIRPSAHIFVGSKAPWFTITDDLPQYQGHVVPSDAPPD